jgi:hypothetical protein
VRLGCRILLAVIAVLLHMPNPASAAAPIAGGHYLFDTPQSYSALFPGSWTLEDAFGGGWSLHVSPSRARFTYHSFIEAELECSPWESQHWLFVLDGSGVDVADHTTSRGRYVRHVSPPPVRIGADGSFSAGRPGEYLGGEFDSHHRTKTTDDAVAWLSLEVSFVSRRWARGWMLATSSDGCSSGWLPIKGRYLRDGWQQYLDRT